MLQHLVLRTGSNCLILIALIKLIGHTGLTVEFDEVSSSVVSRKAEKPNRMFSWRFGLIGSEFLELCRLHSIIGQSQNHL